MQRSLGKVALFFVGDKDCLGFDEMKHQLRKKTGTHCSALGMPKAEHPFTVLLKQR